MVFGTDRQIHTTPGIDVQRCKRSISPEYYGEYDGSNRVNHNTCTNAPIMQVIL